MGFLICFIIPILILFLILLICKWNNFSIIPQKLRLKAPNKDQFLKSYFN